MKKISYIALLTTLTLHCLGANLTTAQFKQAVEQISNAQASGAELSISDLLKASSSIAQYITKIPGLKDKLADATYKTTGIKANMAGQTVEIKGTFVSAGKENFTIDITLLAGASLPDNPKATDVVTGSKQAGSKEATSKLLHQGLTTLAALRDSSLAFNLGTQLKASDISSKLKPLDMILGGHADAALISSNVMYLDPTWGTIEPSTLGINIGLKIGLSESEFDLGKMLGSLNLKSPHVKAFEQFLKYVPGMTMGNDLIVTGFVKLPSMTNTRFKVLLPGTIGITGCGLDDLKHCKNKKSIFATTPITLELIIQSFIPTSLDAVALSVVCGLEFSLVKEQKPERFYLTFTFESDTTLAMTGALKDIKALPIPKFPIQLKDAFLTASINLAQWAETVGTIPINGIGLGGTIDILGRDITAMVCFTESIGTGELAEFVLLARLAGAPPSADLPKFLQKELDNAKGVRDFISLKEIMQLEMELAKKAVDTIPGSKKAEMQKFISMESELIDKLPDLKLTSAQFYFAYGSAFCGTEPDGSPKAYPDGIGVQTSGTLFDAEFNLDFRLNYATVWNVPLPYGIYASGCMSEIALPTAKEPALKISALTEPQWRKRKSEIGKEACVTKKVGPHFLVKIGFPSIGKNSKPADAVIDLRINGAMELNVPGIPIKGDLEGILSSKGMNIQADAQLSDMQAHITGQLPFTDPLNTNLMIKATQPGLTVVAGKVNKQIGTLVTKAQKELASGVKTGGKKVAELQAKLDQMNKLKAANNIASWTKTFNTCWDTGPGTVGDIFGSIPGIGDLIKKALSTVKDDMRDKVVHALNNIIQTAALSKHLRDLNLPIAPDKVLAGAKGIIQGVKDKIEKK